jgi:hypothetical protein
MTDIKAAIDHDDEWAAVRDLADKFMELCSRADGLAANRPPRTMLKAIGFFVLEVAAAFGIPIDSALMIVGDAARELENDCREATGEGLPVRWGKLVRFPNQGETP